MGGWTNRGLADLATVELGSVTLRAALVTAVPAAATLAALDTVGDLADELAGVDGYQRQTLTGVTAVAGPPVRLVCNPVGFGALEAGAIPTGVAVFRRQGPVDDPGDPLWVIVWHYQHGAINPTLHPLAESMADHFADLIGGV